MRPSSSPTFAPRFAVAFALACGVGLLPAAPGHARQVAGVDVAETLTSGGRALLLNGAGVRTKVVFKVYVASLYAPTKVTSLKDLGAGPRRVQMTMLRSLSSTQLVDALDEGLKANNPPATLSSLQVAVDAFRAVLQGFGDVKEGSTIALDYADGQTTITLNGGVRGTIHGDAFNVAMLRIWLGDHPVQDDLKAQLLGG